MLHLKKAGDILVCPSCLKLVLERKDEWRRASERNVPYAEPAPTAVKTAETRLVGLLKEKGAPFLEDVTSAGRVLSKEFIGLITVRVALYLPSMTLLDPSGQWYAIIQGVMAGDLVTWFVLSVLQLPLAGVNFAIELSVYSTLTAWLTAGGNLFNTPDDPGLSAMMMLAFLLTGFLKTGWWTTKIFCLDQQSGTTD
ncbi:MAG: hypothetical protein HY762_02150 [Planctomycetes bacterium]|nr:hypothetical protein [Planctomycetota bacterium]